MPQAFSFGFDGDDYEKDGEDRLSGSGKVQYVDTQGPASEPAVHTIKELLSYLPSRISYSWITITSNNGHTVALPHRELFDIRAQIMAEDASSENEPIAGLSNDDITPHVYEGGFKTWECSVDLATYLASDIPEQEFEGQGHGWNIIELGAGSALPSLLLFDSLLSQRNPKPPSSPSTSLTVADYNLSVLTLSTVPNFLLTWAARHFLLGSESTGDLEVSPELCDRFLLDLENRNIQFSCISGAWSPKFEEFVPTLSFIPEKPVKTMVLASETIYSLDTMSSFVATLLALLQKNSDVGVQAVGLIAAKRVYFGVGGGVDEFVRVLEIQGGTAKAVWQSEDAGVGRVILEVESTRPLL